ncbi:MAG: cupin domain-containing protein [Fuscovulum sp.]|jgi:anti-sigma factor ChrR (cupin superfamily)|nr:cupin domain-containing protein [Paracoccaceae bacterium]MCZ8083814.1 cupin domain-containing protein [Paracoccaceae bacterium]WRH61378.1 MAG: cupin domain-containing protein [Fuscovulum sp.]
MDDPQAFAALLMDWRRQEFLPFREGVEIAVLRAGAPGVALLRYAPGAGVPRHRHPALETILVLEGVQSDERGDYPAGSLILNPEGTEHSVWSETGCTVLIQWNLPVEFVT